MDENNVTTVTEEVVETTQTEETKASGINLSAFDKATQTAKKQPTAEELLIEIEKLKAEKEKIKASFDNKAREKALADKKAKEAEKKATEPIEELAKVQRELEEMKISNMKTSLTYTLSKEWQVSDEITQKMVNSIFSEETGGFVEGDFRTAQMELIQSVREQAKKEGYEEREKEILNGKPRSIGNSNKTIDPFEEIMNEFKK